MIPTPSAGRIVRVTATLSVLGAVVGGVLGAVLIALPLGVPISNFKITGQALYIGALFGGVMGAVLAPIAAWTLMRHVPIWRAIADTCVGTLIGAVIGLIFQPRYDTAWLSPPLLGIGGFVLAAIRLRFSKRARGSEISAPAG
jgi:hypothetical protein